MPITFVRKGARVFGLYQCLFPGTKYSHEDAYHRDNARPAGIFEQFDVLARPRFSVCPTITEPKSVLQGLLRDNLHGVSKLALIRSCHFTVQSSS